MKTETPNTKTPKSFDFSKWPKSNKPHPGIRAVSHRDENGDIVFQFEGEAPVVFPSKANKK